MNQDWRDLTYLHWAVPPERVAHHMPPGVRPDTLDGSTYVGLVPFHLVDAAPGRSSRAVPYLGTFLETNVRLYSVDVTGRRGVVFLSLDTDRLPVVLGARLCFGVPYRWARMRHTSWPVAGGEQHRYDARLRRPGKPVTSRITVQVGTAREADDLDHFVSARWGLHTRRADRTWYVPNTHQPWPLHHTELVELHDGLLASVGLGELAGRSPDHIAFSPGVHTAFGLPTDARRPRTYERPARSSGAGRP